MFFFYILTDITRNPHAVKFMASVYEGGDVGKRFILSFQMYVYSLLVQKDTKSSSPIVIYVYNLLV